MQQNSGESSITTAVISLTERGKVADEIEAIGVPVWCLNLQGISTLPRVVWRLRQMTRQFQPDLIQGWMYHGNLAASLAGRIATGNPKITWGIRQSLPDISREKPMTRKVIALSARVSRGPDQIIYNSHTARSQHEMFGFDATHARVIDNGFDPDHFHPDPAARRALRTELAISERTQLIGLVARYHPLKGQDIFLRAAMRLLEINPDADQHVKFLMAGRDATPDNPALASYFQNSHLARHVICLGERSDIPSITAGLDIATSTSWGEAFPNAVGEAMACGVPVVATDVGDVSRIIEGAGITVTPGDPDGIARAWTELLADPDRREMYGKQGREKVIREFSIKAASQSYSSLYYDLLSAT